MRRFLLALLLLALIASSLEAAGIFDRKPKPSMEGKPPAEKPSEAERVQTLVSTLLLDKDEDSRSGAAEQLARLDGRKYPEAVTALIEAVQKDKESGVRRAAVKSLGKIRPTTSEALQALEQAGKDDSYLVRLDARMARWGYKVAESPAPAPPTGGAFIKVPPPGADGRLKPVPIPSAEEVAEPVREAPPPVLPTLSRPTPKSKEKPGDGPILIAPRQP